jgi:hypothetical protein
VTGIHAAGKLLNLFGFIARGRDHRGL